jgi:hypothetical protein
MPLNQREQEYNFDDNFFFSQNFTQEVVSLLRNRFERSSIEEEDRDPSERRNKSYLTSTTGDLVGVDNDEADLNKGISIFRWASSIENPEDTDNMLVCDISRYNLRRDKQIATTIPFGSDSSIKEYLYTNDYRVTFNGTLYNQKPDLYPKRSMNKFKSMVDRIGVIDITNEFLNETFGIFKVIITSHRIDQSDIGNIQNISFEAITQS